MGMNPDPPVDRRPELKALQADRWHHYVDAMERGRLTADDVRAMEGLPPLLPKTPIEICPNADIVDVTHMGSTKREYVRAVTGERVYQTWDYGWLTGAELSALWPDGLYKLALATAAVWVAAVVTGVM